MPSVDATVPAIAAAPQDKFVDLTLDSDDDAGPPAKPRETGIMISMPGARYDSLLCTLRVVHDLR
jgi:hypothetical protein